MRADAARHLFIHSLIGLTGTLKVMLLIDVQWIEEINV